MGSLATEGIATYQSFRDCVPWCTLSKVRVNGLVRRISDVQAQSGHHMMDHYLSHIPMGRICICKVRIT